MTDMDDEVDWNNDPEWVEYVYSLRPVIMAIAVKKTTDQFLREDCVQESLMELLKVVPEEDIDAWQEYQAGEISKEAWERTKGAYCRQVAHFTILSLLHSRKTGDIYTGRSVRKKDPRTGERVTVHEPPRFSSLEQLREESGLQVDHTGELSWDQVSEDGINHG